MKLLGESFNEYCDQGRADAFVGKRRVAASTRRAAFRALPNLQRQWIMDSGASRTTSSNRHWFHTFTRLPTPITISLGNNSTILATGTSHVPGYVCSV